MINNEQTIKSLKLDVKDLKLLKELEIHSLESLSSIAKKIGVSKEVAHYRYNRLIEEGLIKKFEVLIDYFKMGYNLYRIIINLENINHDIKKTIITELRKKENINITVYLSSSQDIEINMWVKNSEEFYIFYNEFMEKYSKYIGNKEIYIVTKTHIINKGYIHGNSNEIILGEETEKIEIDEMDKKIISLLKLNAKEDVISIAKKMSLAQSTLSYRIKQLIKNKIIRGYFPVLNTSLLGFNQFRVGIILNNPIKKKKLIAYLKTQKNIIAITEIIGNKDIDFDIDYKTSIELDTFLEKLRTEIPEIKDFEVRNILTD